MTPTPLDEEQVAAYAVGALDGAEATETRAALAEDPDGQGLLAGHRDTLAALAALDALDPPPAVWAGIQARLGADRPFTEATFTLQRRSEPEDWHHDSRPPSMAPSPHVGDDRVRGFRSRDRWGPTVRLALAAAAVVALGLVGLGLVTRDDDPPTLAQVAVGALDDPSARQATLSRAEGDPPVARGAVWPSGVGCVVVDDLDPLPPGEVYQVWMLADAPAAPISLGFVDPDANDGVAAFTLDPAATGLALSREPAGGAVAPSVLVATGTFT